MSRPTLADLEAVAVRAGALTPVESVSFSAKLGELIVCVGEDAEFSHLELVRLEEAIGSDLGRVSICGWYKPYEDDITTAPAW